MKRLIYILIAIIWCAELSVSARRNIGRENHQSELAQLFISTSDSFRISLIEGNMKKANVWLDAAYRSVKDSDTYYSYRAMDANIRVLTGQLTGIEEDSKEIINYFKGRTDTLGVRMSIMGNCALGTLMMYTETDQAIYYFDIALKTSESINDVDMVEHCYFMKSETYQRTGMFVEAAECSRHVLNNATAKSNRMFRFLAQLQLYKIYTQMRANSMVGNYGKSIEQDGFYLTSLTLEAKYLLRKGDYLLTAKRFKEAEECSQRLLLTCELTGTEMEIWRVHLQAAKVCAATGKLDEAMKHIKHCKSKAIYASGYRSNVRLYSSYNVDLTEALVNIKRQNYVAAKEILERSNPTEEILNEYEYGVAYYRMLETIHSKLGDYKTAVKMVDANDKLRAMAYEIHSQQRSQDLDLIYQNDTTLLSQDATLLLKTKDLSTLQNNIIIGILLFIFATLAAILFNTHMKKRKRQEETKMDIAKRNRLEEEISRQTEELTTQRNEIKRKNMDIIMSQSYAKVIQEGVLPNPVDLNYDEFTGTFIIYKPVDVVSGDFYWFRKFGDKIIVCCADCSGHGIPGAMMTMIGLTLLSDITRNRKCYIASEMLEDLDAALLNMMPDIRRHDAIDVSIAVIDTNAHKINISLAHQNMVLKIGEDIIHIEGDKRRIGFSGSAERFSDAFYDYSKGDSLYMYTDGLFAIPGGRHGDKLTQQQFLEILSQCLAVPISNRGNRIERYIAEWMDHNEQLDDYSIVGIEL